jgi:hypothetical protein
MKLNQFICGALSACLISCGIAWADDAAAPSTQPTTVTIHATEADPQQVFEDILKAGGLKTAVNNPWMWGGINSGKPALISVNFDHVPFWQAMAQYCAATHCMVYSDYQGGIRVQPNSEPGMLGGVMDTFGSYAIVATNVERDANINLINSRTSHNDYLHLQLYVDPAVQALRSAQPWLTQADDDNGQSMLPDAPPQAQMMMNGQMGNNLSFQGSAALKYPPQVGRRLVNVSGEWDVEAPSEFTVLTIDDVAAAAGKTTTAGDYSITIISADLLGRNGRINLTANRKPAPQNPVNGMFAQVFPGVRPGSPPDFLMNKMQGGAIKLIDADGNVTTPSGGGGGGMDQVQWNLNVMQMNNQTPWGKAPIKLVWKIPTKTRIEAVTFHFKDLPLPQE